MKTGMKLIDDWNYRGWFYPEIFREVYIMTHVQSFDIICPVKYRVKVYLNRNGNWLHIRDNGIRCFVFNSEGECISETRGKNWSRKSPSIRFLSPIELEIEKLHSFEAKLRNSSPKDEQDEDERQKQFYATLEESQRLFNVEQTYQ